jgi:hypothetical protein
MKISGSLQVLAAWIAPMVVLGQVSNNAMGVLNNAGGGVGDPGATGNVANPAQVTGQLNGLLGGLGLNNLDLSQVLTINWDNDKARISTRPHLLFQSLTSPPWL